MLSSPSALISVVSLSFETTLSSGRNRHSFKGLAMLDVASVYEVRFHPN
jgi:hypothetical protein